MRTPITPEQHAQILIQRYNSIRTAVPEKLLLQIFLGAKDSIQEFTLGPKVAEEMRRAYALAQRELFPPSQRSEKKEEKPLTNSQQDRQTWLEDANENDESSPTLSKEQLKGLLNDFLDRLIARKSHAH